MGMETDKKKPVLLGPPLVQGKHSSVAQMEKWIQRWCASKDVLYGRAIHWLANRPQSGTLTLSQDWNSGLKLKAVVSASTEQ